jgi:hypothetical protein
MSTTSRGSGLRAAALAVVLSTLAVACEELGNLTDAGAPDSGGGSGGTGGSPAMACGFPDFEPNDSRDTATPYTAGRQVRECVGTATDVDFFEVRSPADPAGGFFAGALTDVGPGTIEVKVYSASDNAALLENVQSLDEGGSVYFYWAAAPGQTYRVAVGRFGGGSAPFAYSLTASYTAVVDPFEPNDVKAQAAMITPGRAVSARMFAGHRAKLVTREEYFDWYRFQAATGTVTVTIDEVPSNVSLLVELQGPAGAAINPSRGQEFNDTAGGSIQATFPVGAGGAHHLRVELWANRTDTAAQVNTPRVPDNFTRSYRMTVSQP